MSTERRATRRPLAADRAAVRSVRRRVALAAGLAAAVSTVALAQGTGAVPVPGRGAGYHDPRSAFAPLQEREGVVAWSLLSSVSTKVERNRVIPTFPPAVQALDNQPVKVQGFMLPLGTGAMQTHFLLSAVPTTCSFCVPAGPEGLIEVRTRTPVKVSVDAILIEGRMAVLTNDPYGLLYRVVDAAPLPMP